MANELSTMQDVVSTLEAIVDNTRIFTDPEYLDRYAQDTSLCAAGRPDAVVKVLSTEEVQQIVKLAHEHHIPVTPRSSGVGFYGAGIPEQGGIVIDMSAMKKIRRIDKRNRWVMVEAGVTYGEVQAELAKEGMRVLNPLLAHSEKSVITSTLEREPKLTPKHHLDETILTMEMVLPTGNIFHTGSMAISQGQPEKVPDETHSDLCNFHGPGVDWFRLVPGSLGTFGIVTVMNVKTTLIPTQSKMVFLGFDKLEDCVEPFYHIERTLIGDDCFLLNNRYLASILAADAADIERISSVLPAYTIVLNLTAGEWYPEDKMAYQEEALHDIARTFLVTPLETLPNVPDVAAKISALLYQPWDNGTYWKFRARGASQEVFFLTQLQRSPEFLKVITEVAAQCNYPLSDMGLYIQPKQHGRTFHMEAGFPYDPEDSAQRQRIETVYQKVSEALVTQGAFFYRIYGLWADMVYSRTGTYHKTLKRIKRSLDPHSILNPGKLGF